MRVLEPDAHSRGERYLVLMYHRVAAEGKADFLPPLLTCPLHRFLEHLSVLEQHCSVLPLDEADARTREGLTLPPRTVVLTFDDCWAENLETVAAPLAAAGAPATFFITGGDIDRNDLHPNHLFYYLMAEAGRQRAQAALAPFIGSTAMLFDHRMSMFRIRAEIEGLLGYEFASASGRALLAQLQQRLAITPPPDIGYTLYLRSQDVRQLRSHGIRIGNHTESHRRLPGLPQSELREEVACAQDRLSALTDHAITTFAYPYGMFDDAAIAMVTATDHRSGCTIIKGYNDRNTDCWRLRRIDAARLSGQELLAALTRHGTAP